MTRLHNQNNTKIKNLSETIKDGRSVLSYDCDATIAYGMGERFDGVDIEALEQVRGDHP